MIQQLAGAASGAKALPHARGGAQRLLRRAEGRQERPRARGERATWVQRPASFSRRAGAPMAAPPWRWRCGAQASGVDGTGSPGSCAALRLRARQKRRFRPRTTDSRHLCPIAPNHLAERVSPPARPGDGVAGGHYLCRHQGGLALRGRRARRVLAPDRGLGRGRHDAHRPDTHALLSGRSRRSGPRPGCFTTRIAAASTPATPTGNCCVAMGRDPEHEPGGQLLRQRQDGELLGDA